jgi:nucleotide-binding universal stress UspA family protein
MKKVLCPVDLSETSRHALQEAIQMAECGDVAVMVLRVHQPHAVTSLEDLGDDFQPVLERGDRLAFREWLEEIRKETTVTFDEHFVVGEPASTILDVAAEGNYDMIVIGNKGRTAINRFLLGSVTSKVVHHAPCNVLLVK